MNNRRWYPVSRLAPEQIKVLKHSMDPSMTVLLPGVETATAYGCKLVSYHRGGEDQSRVDIDLPVALAFLVDQVQQTCCPLFQAAWNKMKTKCHLWEEIR